MRSVSSSIIRRSSAFAFFTAASVVASMSRCSRRWPGGGARPEDPRLPGGEGCARSGPRRVWALQMDKALESWWRSALVGPAHPQIDAQLVDSSQPVDAYDAETQAAIRKIVHEQAEKAAARGGAGEAPPPDLAGARGE